MTTGGGGGGGGGDDGAKGRTVEYVFEAHAHTGWCGRARGVIDGGIEAGLYEYCGRGATGFEGRKHFRSSYRSREPGSASRVAMPPSTSTCS